MAIDSAPTPPPPPREPQLVEQSKRAAARAAAALVHDGMNVGLGTGSTVAHLLPALAEMGLSRVRCVATSIETERVARELRLAVCTLDELDGRLDIAIDGADQVDEQGWLVKGGGAAHTREKIVACSAERFVVIVSPEKLVSRLSPPVPLELLRFGVTATLNALAPSELRDVPPSPDGNLIADYRGEIGDRRDLASRLSAMPGVVEHGIFPPELVSEILVGEGERVRRIAGGKRPSS